MTTALIYDDHFLDHDTGPGHPERPDRLRAITKGLHQAELWDRLDHLSFEPADPALIETTHTPAYINRLRETCIAGEPFIDTPDSAICPRSYEVALLAAGGVLAATEAVMAGEVRNAFCAVRPPGHHAETGRSMGFCLINNAAVAATHLINRHGLERVAVVDFDVHHGNGTQQIFDHRRDVLFISLHEHPAHQYPGSGFETETGTGQGKGYTLNLPMAPGSGDDQYRHAFETAVSPALDRFQPQFLIISAGFDAADGDPLANVRVSTEGFAWITEQLVHTARQHCDGRVVSTLEGGYNLDNLSRGVAAHVGVLLDNAG